MGSIMTSTPLVSVIVACFNSERYLATAIESVLAQTYRNLEIVMVDDCSTDGTVELIRSYQQHDDRIRLIQHDSRGGRPAITKNTGLKAIRGDFVCFLDHDDYYAPNKISVLLGQLITHSNCVAAFHEIDLVDEKGHFISRYLDNFTTEAKQFLIPASNGVYLGSERFFAFQSIHYAAMHTISVMIAVERLGHDQLFFDQRYKVCDDTDLWLRLGLAGTVVYVDNSLASYRQHDTNITRDLVKVQEDALLFMESNYQRVSNALTADEQNQLRARIANNYNNLGWIYRQKYLPKKSIPAYLKEIGRAHV